MIYRHGLAQPRTRRSKKLHIFTFKNILLLCLTELSFQISAEDIKGKFLNGANYDGLYDKSEVTVDGGQKMEREKFSLQVNYDGKAKDVTYTYDSDGPSQIKANPLGFISITTHTGSMDGDLITAYIFFDGTKLVSIGNVDISLTKNVASSVHVNDYNRDASDDEKFDFISGVLASPNNLILKEENIFENASIFFIATKLKNKNIKDDKNFFKLKEVPKILKKANYQGYPELFSKKILD